MQTDLALHFPQKQNRLHGPDQQQTGWAIFNPLSHKSPFSRARLFKVPIAPNYQPFPKRQILDSYKLKGFADDNFRFNENGRKFLKG